MVNRRLLSVLALASFVLTSRRALANEECPPGAVYRTVDTYTFCEATVCEADMNCQTGEVCRPVALCLQIGTLERDGGGQRGADAAAAPSDKCLVATQRCGPEKSCPQSTTCSDRKRCLARATADRMGILTDTPPPQAEPAPKKSCGCRVPGSPTGGTSAAAAALLALGLIVRGRRAYRR